jgi:hypothetical protein
MITIFFAITASIVPIGIKGFFAGRKVFIAEIFCRKKGIFCRKKGILFCLYRYYRKKGIYCENKSQSISLSPIGALGLDVKSRVSPPGAKVFIVRIKVFYFCDN